RPTNNAVEFKKKGATIAGLLNAFLAGFIMDKTDAYRLILKFLLIGACASAIFFILILRPNQFNRLSLSI
ncbi:unnamed protein product, partial [Rotaria sp. Silwood1]